MPGASNRAPTPIGSASKTVAWFRVPWAYEAWNERRLPRREESVCVAWVPRTSAEWQDHETEDHSDEIPTCGVGMSDYMTLRQPQAHARAPGRRIARQLLGGNVS